jgi:hypothetical protein
MARVNEKMKRIEPSDGRNLGLDNLDYSPGDLVAFRRKTDGEPISPILLTVIQRLRKGHDEKGINLVHHHYEFDGVRWNIIPRDDLVAFYAGFRNEDPLTMNPKIVRIGPLPDPIRINAAYAGEEEIVDAFRDIYRKNPRADNACLFSYCAQLICEGKLRTERSRIGRNLGRIIPAGYMPPCPRFSTI